MDLDRLHVPLAAFPDDDPAVLRERLTAALRVCAESLGCGEVEVVYDDASESLAVRRFVLVTYKNLAAARAFGDVEAGDELGLDVWDLSEEVAGFLAIDGVGWEVFRERSERALRGLLTAGRRAREVMALGPWLAGQSKALAKWRRTAWVPDVTLGLPKDLSRGTYYGGPAWLGPGEAWPRCAACGTAMGLLLHLDVATSPFVGGVGRAYEVFQCACGRGELARAVSAEATPQPTPLAAAREVKRVASWRAVDDYSGFAAADEAFTACMAVRGDKLGGWPARQQGTREEPFPCPVCGGDTTLVFQLDSDSPTEGRWGDMGRAWLFVCQEHPERPLLFWESS